jgi:hypothetical protein
MDSSRPARVWLVSAVTLAGAILAVTAHGGWVFWLGLGLVLAASVAGVAGAAALRRRNR